MGEFQDTIDHDNLEQARNNLKKYMSERNKRIATDVVDKFQLDFIKDNPDLTFEEIRLLKRFSDYIKNK